MNFLPEQKPNFDKKPIVIPSAQLAANQMLPAVLHLTLKKKWFDMIKAGVKKEEYRELKDYWFDRLTEDDYPLRAKKIDFVLFRNGYSKDAPQIKVECLGILIGDANPEWSDNWKGGCFVIQLGAVVA
jgi:hypothetical protein